MANDYFNHQANVIATGVRALAAQVNNIAYEIATGFDKLPEEAELKLGLTRYAVDTGIADAYILTLPYVPTLTDGFNFYVKTANENTGACTINVNATGIKAITNSDGSDLVAGTLRVNGIAILAYEAIADSYTLISQNPEQAALAAVSAAEAAVSAAAALVSEGNASTSATNASNSETAAASSAAAALVSENAAAATYDEFDDRYLGDKATPPTLDNDGNALLTGALYFDTSVNLMYVWNGATWQLTTVAPAGGADTQVQYNNGGALAGSADFVYEFGVLSLADSMVIDSSAGNTGLEVNQTAVGENAAYFWGNANDAVALVVIDKSNGSSTGAALQIQHIGTGPSIDIGAGDITTAGNIVMTSTSPTIDLVSATSTPSIRLSGGGGVPGTASLDITHSENTARINHNVTGGSLYLGTENIDVITIDATQQTLISSAGADVLLATATAAAGTALRAYSNVATRTVPVMEVVNDNATGSGDALYVQQDQGGYALDVFLGNGGGGLKISGNNTVRSTPLVDLSIGAASGAAQKVIQIVNGENDATAWAIDITGNGPGIHIASAGGGGSPGLGTALDIEVFNNFTRGINVSAADGSSVYGIYSELTGTASSGTAGSFYTNIASRSQPLVEIVSDNASGGNGYCLLLQQDGNGAGGSVEFTGKGWIKFPATNTVSTDVNVLDDYQEGVFTPEIWDGSNSGAEGQTYGANNLGRYVKIGKVVHFQGRLDIAGLGTLTTGAQARIGNLPFTSLSDGSAGGIQIYYMSGINVTAGSVLSAQIVPNALGANIWAWDAADTAASSLVTVAEITAAGDLWFSGSYQTLD